MADPGGLHLSDKDQRADTPGFFWSGGPTV